MAHALAELGAQTDLRAFGVGSPVIRDELEWRPLADLKGLEGAEALVLDGYEFPPEFVAATAGVAPLVWFDDSGDAPAEARLVIAPALTPSPPAPGRAVLAGLEHVALGRQFWQPPPPEPATAVNRLLVTWGGTDASARSVQCAIAARDVAPNAATVLVRGPHTSPLDAPEGIEVVGPLPSLADELAAADLVVGAAGQTMLEAAAFGTPSLVAVVAANQTAGAAELERRGAVRIFDPDDPLDLRDQLSVLAGDPAIRDRMAAAGRATVDGQGAGRIASAIVTLAGAG